MSDARQRTGTKIVATLGPASCSETVVEQLLHAGADVVRLNFSHGQRQDHEQVVRTVRAVSKRLDHPVAFMGDLCGPKIRLLEVDAATPPLKPGQQLRIQSQPEDGGPSSVGINHPEIIPDVEVGQRVLIDDGAIRLHVVSKDAAGLLCECDVGGRLSSRKGLNLPDTDLRRPALTDKDREDVAWAVERGLEYIALSFVRRAEDVAELRRQLGALQADCLILSKIETRHAVENLAEIIDASDGILVARGDLGVEVDVAIVPRLQKEITEHCRRAGKPAIIATQMLQSMVESPTPTRAEVNDVANAIFDGADAVLLSAETAVGKHPAAAVRMLERIALETECCDQGRLSAVEIGGGGSKIAPAVARSLCSIANEIEAKAVVVWTERGTLARLLSKHRLDRPVLALARTPEIRRRLSLYYGVVPLQAARPAQLDDRMVLADRVLIEGGYASAGDTVVLGFGPQTAALGNTGSIIIHTVEGSSTA